MECGADLKIPILKDARHDASHPFFVHPQAIRVPRQWITIDTLLFFIFQFLISHA